MRRTIAMITGAGLLALAPVAVWAQTPENAAQPLEHLMVESAHTPAEHQALARYYRTKAADAKALAAEHRAMGKSYVMGKLAHQKAMKQHCDKIAQLNEQIAAQYEALAKGEDQAAAAKPKAK